MPCKQGQQRPFLFDEAKNLVDDLLISTSGGGSSSSSSSFDAVQVPSFPSADYLSFAAEVYLRCPHAPPSCFRIDVALCSRLFHVSILWLTGCCIFAGTQFSLVVL
jgi:hypothetical protein